MFSLSPEEQDQYRTDGYLTRHAVLDAGEVRALQRAAENAADRAFELCGSGHHYVLDGKRFVDSGYRTIQFEHAPDSEKIRVIEPVQDLDAGLDGLVDDPRIVEPMMDLVGSASLSLWTAKLNLKYPREGSGFPWHQDSPYWIHDCRHVDRLPNVLVAFDDCTVTNGCLRIIRGSHRDGCLPGTDDGSQLGGFYTDPALVDESRCVSMEVPAGSLVFFSPHVIHGSEPNTSALPRRALVLTYQPGGFPQLKSGKVRNIRIRTERT